MKVHDLTPGVQIENPMGGVCTFITRDDQHPLYVGLALVVWKLPDGSWSFDALDPRQDVGDPLPATRQQLTENVRAALFPGGA